MQTPFVPADGPSRDDETPEQRDWQSMQAHFQGQPEMLAALTQVAIATLPDVSRRLRSALAEQATETLATIAHEVKGSALNLRAQQLASLASATQDLARQGDIACLAKADALATLLERFIDRLSGKPAPAIDQ
jgi:HPt (histidine-containing phosphotransfer) domain-containing protein